MGSPFYVALFDCFHLLFRCNINNCTSSGLAVCWTCCSTRRDWVELPYPSFCLISEATLLLPYNSPRLHVFCSSSILVTWTAQPSPAAHPLARLLDAPCTCLQRRRLATNKTASFIQKRPIFISNPSHTAPLTLSNIFSLFLLLNCRLFLPLTPNGRAYLHPAAISRDLEPRKNT